MKKNNLCSKCSNLMARFEAIGPDHMGEMLELLASPEVVSHRRECPDFDKWVTNFQKRFVE